MPAQERLRVKECLEHMRQQEWQGQRRAAIEIAATNAKDALRRSLANGMYSDRSQSLARQTDLVHSVAARSKSGPEWWGPSYDAPRVPTNAGAHSPGRASLSVRIHGAVGARENSLLDPNLYGPEDLAEARQLQPGHTDKRMCTVVKDATVLSAMDDGAVECDEFASASAHFSNMATLEGSLDRLVQKLVDITPLPDGAVHAEPSESVGARLADWKASGRPIPHVSVSDRITISADSW